MADVKAIKQKLIDEIDGRDMHKMSAKELEDYARAVNAIACIPERSYTDYFAALTRSDGGLCASGGVSNG